MSCAFEEDVSAWYDGELTDAEAARVVAHIDQCASCAALVADFDSVRRSLRESLRVAAADHGRPGTFWKRRVAIPLPIAAVLAIFFISAPFIAFHRGERARPTAPPAAIVRQTDSGLLTQYDGGGRAVITVRPKEQAR
jgi:putative zinc finger protein